jgi:predicted dehydrogenase
MMSRICLVGAGDLSRKHVEALQGLPGHQIAAIVDSDTAAAQRLARRSGAGKVFTSVEEALADEAFDRAHVLVAPEMRPQVALPLLAAGKPVLLEQPVAIDAEACDSMLEAARKSGAAFGVTDGFMHHPAFVRLQELVARQELGRTVMVFCLRNIPRSEVHGLGGEGLLLEHALHPLTQITAIAGPIDKARAFAGPSIELSNGEKFPSPLDLSLTCADLSARLRISIGRRRPLWQVTAICDDGVAVADILENRIDTHGRTRWRDAMQDLSTDLACAGSELNHALRNILDAAVSLVYPARRGNPIRIGLRRSIAAFHSALDAGKMPQPDGKLAAELVALCRRVADQARRSSAAAA